VDVEVPSVEVKNGSSIHDLAPFERTEDPTGSSQLFEWSRINLTPVIDGEIPVAVRSEVTTSP
jgi:hypothetical protein